MSVEQELKGALHVAFADDGERVIAMFQVEPEWFAVNMGWMWDTDDDLGELEWGIRPYSVRTYEDAFEIFNDLVEREFKNV